MNNLEVYKPWFSICLRNSVVVFFIGMWKATRDIKADTQIFWETISYGRC